MIIKNISTVNGMAQYHVLKKIESVPPYTSLTLTVDSFFNEETYQLGGNMLTRTMVSMPEPDSINGIATFAESWLIADASSIFQGGTLTADTSSTLEAAQARAWVRIKACRAQKEVGNFEYDGGTYQADITRINGAATLALMAKLANVPYTIDWTLTDNTVRTLDGNQMMAMGRAVGQYVDSVYRTARELRVLIAAATTVEEADAIVWPMGGV